MELFGISRRRKYIQNGTPRPIHIQFGPGSISTIVIYSVCLAQSGVAMASNARVVTANLPGMLVDRLDNACLQIDRTKSWIIRQALSDWLAEQQRRHELTLDALVTVEKGSTFTQEQVDALFEERRRGRRASLDPE